MSDSLLCASRTMRDVNQQKISHTLTRPINNTQTSSVREIAICNWSAFLAAFFGVTTMAHASCKRIWEGTLGIAISPRKKRDGDYFWSFSFVRAFRRTRESKWEYVQHFGQQHATALGILMSKAFHFMEQNDPGNFLERAMAEATSSRPSDEETAEPTIADLKPPPPVRAAA